MKNFWAALVLAAGLAGSAEATVIDFEGGQIPPEFQASGVTPLYTPTYFTQDTGYVRGRTSGDWVGFAAQTGGHIEATNGSTFDFIGGNFTAAWNDDLQLTLLGYRGGVEYYRSTFTISDDFPSNFLVNFHNIDSLAIWALGGTDAGTPGGGEFVAMDDLRFGPASVPEVTLASVLDSL